MAEQSKNIIKKTYDSYINSDYQYGSESSVTLNPVREVKFDQIEVIRRRLQEVTDDLVRRKIIKEQPGDKPISVSLSPGALPDKNSLLRQAAQINTGGIGLGVIFPAIDGPNNGMQNILEPLIGSFPSQLLLGNLDVPLALDCDVILKSYNLIKDDDSDDDDDDNNNDDDSDGDGDGSGSDGSGGTNPPTPPTTPTDPDAQTEFEACAMIEMDWLKIILILLRIIKIIQTILDLIMAILVPLMEIVLLALMCWLIPPAAEQLRQRITEMVMAIVIMIITKLIAMIFGLLNLDCLCDQTMDIINQIRQAMSAFSSLMSVFNINSVNMMFGNAFDQLKDPMDAIAEMYAKKKEAWSKIKSEWTGLDLNQMWKDTKTQIVSGAKDAIATDPNVQKAVATATAAYDFMKKDIIDVIAGLNKAKKVTAGGSTASAPKSDEKVTLQSLIEAPGFTDYSQE
jgi:hypothetical protein